MASIIRPTTIGQLGTLAVASNRRKLRSVLRLLVTANVPSWPTTIGQLGTSAVASNRRKLRSVLRLLATANLVTSAPIVVTLMMEAIRSCDTAVHIKTTRRNIPVEGILHSHRREIFKSYKNFLNSLRWLVQVKFYVEISSFWISDQILASNIKSLPVSGIFVKKWHVISNFRFLDACFNMGSKFHMKYKDISFQSQPKSLYSCQLLDSAILFISDQLWTGYWMSPFQQDALRKTAQQNKYECEKYTTVVATSVSEIFHCREWNRYEM
jgi:hypothetical protein